MPIFEEGKVDLVFSGHEHNYERLSKNGVVYVITGGGGAPLYDFGNILPFSQFRSKSHHFILGQIEGCKLTLQAIGLQKQIIDQFSLKKCN